MGRVCGGAVLDCQEGSTAKGPFKLNDTLNVFRYRREDMKMPQKSPNKSTSNGSTEELHVRNLPTENKEFVFYTFPNGSGTLWTFA